MKAISMEKLIKNDSFCWQAVVAVILVVLIAKLINANPISSERRIFLLDVEFTDF